MADSKNGQTNGNGNGKSATKTKAPTDYGKAFEEWDDRAEGLERKVERSERELRRLLGGHENATKIMQIIDRPHDGYGALVARRTVAIHMRDRAKRLLDASTVTPVVSIPIAPTNGETSAPAPAEVTA